MRVVKFQVGDIVKAKSGNGYGITTNGWEGEVTSVSENGDYIEARGKNETGRAINYDRLIADKFTLMERAEDMRRI